MPNSLTSMSTKRPLTSEEKAMADRMKAIVESMPDLTQDSIGNAVGVSQGQVWQWLDGRLQVSAKRAPALAQALGIKDPSEISVAYREMVRPQPVENKASHSPRLDAKILAATHRALREIHAETSDLPYNLEDDPEHFLQAYELRAKLSQVSAADLVQIFKVAGL
jgi:transcriptional regulator with XRE-family HTH domain